MNIKIRRAKATSHKEVCSQMRNCCVENKKIPPQIEKSVGGQLDKEEFIKLFYIIKLFFKISVSAMDDKITGSIAPIIFFVSQSSIYSVN